MMVPSLTVAGVVEGLYTVVTLSLLRRARLLGARLSPAAARPSSPPGWRRSSPSRRSADLRVLSAPASAAAAPPLPARGPARGCGGSSLAWCPSRSASRPPRWAWLGLRGAAPPLAPFAALAAPRRAHRLRHLLGAAPGGPAPRRRPLPHRSPGCWSSPWPRSTRCACSPPSRRRGCEPAAAQAAARATWSAGAGGITAALLTLSARNARDIADAMRSRGF